MKLLTNAGNGNGAELDIRQWGNRELEHIYTLYVWGVFDGATVTLEVTPDNGLNWFDTGVLINAKKMQNVEFRGPRVRAVVAGGAAPSVNAVLL